MREQTLNQEYNQVIIKHFPTRFTALEDFLNLKQRRGATWMNPLSSPSFEAKTQTHHDVVVEDAILSNFLFLFLLDTCLEKSNRVYISNHKSFAFPSSLSSFSLPMLSKLMITKCTCCWITYWWHIGGHPTHADKQTLKHNSEHNRTCQLEPFDAHRSTCIERTIPNIIVSEIV